MNPRPITVILPTYNRAGSLERAVRSVLDQSFADFRLLVVDDASTDGTDALLRSIADPRLEVLRLPKNGGAAAARNAGIAAAATEWLAFQDSDDEWLPDRLEQQWRLARSAGPQVALVIGGYRSSTRPGHVVRPDRILAGQDPTPDLLDGSAFITPTWLVRRRILQDLGGFDERFPCLEDWDLVFRLTERGEVRAVPGPLLVKHSSGSASVCADPRRVRFALDLILQRHGHRWQGQPRRLARRLTHLATLQQRCGEPAAARATLRRASAADPAHPAPRVYWLASYAGAPGLRAARWVWPGWAQLGGDA